MPNGYTEYAYREPLPSCDVLLHAGDLTMSGKLQEYEKVIDFLSQADAELKIAIAGNHDTSLDEGYKGPWGPGDTNLERQNLHEDAFEMWNNEAASNAKIVYMEEGTKTFMLNNGAEFTVGCEMEIPRVRGVLSITWFLDLRFYLVYSSSLIDYQIYCSPYQPEFCYWAFGYPRNIDRFNPSPENASWKAPNPVPSSGVDIVLTHGPPLNVLDKTYSNLNVGCEHLLKAVQRVKPRLHCFGHIHEGNGFQILNWKTEVSRSATINPDQATAQRGIFLDFSEDGSNPMRYGEETLFVNAAIMNLAYEPRNAPWVVDIDLPGERSPTGGIRADRET